MNTIYNRVMLEVRFKGKPLNQLEEYANRHGKVVLDCNEAITLEARTDTIGVITDNGSITQITFIS